MYLIKTTHLTNWGRVTHTCVSKLTIIDSDNGMSPGRRQAIIWTKCWNTVNWTLSNKLQWNLNRNSHIFIQENAFENVVCEIASMLSRSQCVKVLSHGCYFWCHIIYGNSACLFTFEIPIDLVAAHTEVVWEMHISIRNLLSLVTCLNSLDDNSQSMTQVKNPCVINYELSLCDEVIQITRRTYIWYQYWTVIMFTELSIKRLHFLLLVWKWFHVAVTFNAKSCIRIAWFSTWYMPQSNMNDVYAR